MFADIIDKHTDKKNIIVCCCAMNGQQIIFTEEQFGNNCLNYVVFSGQSR